jgi:hypothetical protein
MIGPMAFTPMLVTRGHIDLLRVVSAACPEHRCAI